MRRFILISSDKAVKPTSIMGASKRLAEMVLQTIAARPSNTKFIMVRFGNVLGSRGSVVRIFREQIANGGPVTVTDERMVRYFMTIPEAVRLVVEAGSIGENGQVYLFDMGEPVRIMELAERMIRLSGFEPGVDIPIRVTGMRPGEKLYEELSRPSDFVKIHERDRIWQISCPKMATKQFQTYYDDLETMYRAERWHELGKVMHELAWWEPVQDDYKIEAHLPSVTTKIGVQM